MHRPGGRKGVLHFPGHVLPAPYGEGAEGGVPVAVGNNGAQKVCRVFLEGFCVLCCDFPDGTGWECAALDGHCA